MVPGEKTVKNQCPNFCVKRRSINSIFDRKKFRAICAFSFTTSRDFPHDTTRLSMIVGDLSLRFELPFRPLALWQFGTSELRIGTETGLSA